MIAAKFREHTKTLYFRVNFRGKNFRERGLITKILCHENLELYGMCCSTAISISVMTGPLVSIVHVCTSFALR